MNKENSSSYRNVYEKHAEREQKLKQLSKKALYEGLLKLATALGISPEDLIRILAGVQGITPELGRKIDHQWIIEFGTVKVAVPKPELKPELRPPELPETVVPGLPEVEIRKGTAFTRLTGLEDKNTIYEAVNTRHVLPNYVELKNYNPSLLNRIGEWLEDWSVTFFRKKDKAMRLVKARELSMSTHYGKDVPDAPRLEFELIDVETGQPRYGFIYTKGKIIWSLGNLPLSEIVRMIKEIGEELEQ